jgi:segregation and condensation protein A
MTDMQPEQQEQDALPVDVAHTADGSHRLQLLRQQSPQQEEMPFALVQGLVVTRLPEDLYIPPDALEVFLEAFEGPLDLLLYLIRKQNLDILDIPVAEITRQYMVYVDLMKAVRFELAAEYLVMAAMLGEIKSRLLLPRPKSEEGEEVDPRAELVRRLQEYERFKKAAEDMEALPRLERDIFTARAYRPDYVRERPLPDIDMREMLLALKDVFQRAEMFEHHHISREKLSTRERMAMVLEHLQQCDFVPFVSLFNPEEGRLGVVVTFIAVLELVKNQLIELIQTEPFGSIHVRARVAALDDSIQVDDYEGRVQTGEGNE